MRRWAVGILVAISVLTLILGTAALWTRRHVVNTDVFVSTTEQVVNDKAVQARVTDQVVTAILAQESVQTAINQAILKLPPAVQRFRPSIEDGVRSLLTTGVRTVLTSAAFNQVVRATLTRAHEQLMAGQDIRFSIGDAKAAVPASAKTGAVGQILSLIPDNLGITVLDKSQAPGLYSAIDLLKRLWLWMGIASLGTLAAALAVSHRRRRTLRAWSVSAGVGALVLAFGVTVARPVMLAQAKPAGRDAAGAVYDIVVGSLRAWALWLALIMAVLAVVVSLWGRLHVFSALRRAFAAGRAGLSRRRVPPTPGEATVPGEAAAPGERVPWYRRVAAWVGAFVDGLELPRRLSGPAAAITTSPAAWRWSGVVVGFLVLVIWPDPTLSVVLWVAAVVALYLGLLRLVQVIAARSASGEPAEVPPPAIRPERETVAVEPAAPVERRRPVTELASSDTKRLEAANTGLNSPTVVDELVTTDARLSLLTRLGRARSDGLLSEAEFTREKVRLMDYQTPSESR